MDKNVLIKIVMVLNGLIGELAPQMGAQYTRTLFGITKELEDIIDGEENRLDGGKTE